MPPFGPIGPYLDPPPRRREAAPEEPEVERSRITPLQIALTVGGVVLLLALGIGGALLFLGEDDPTPAPPAPVESDQEGDPFGQFTPSPNNPQPQESQPAAPDPAPSDDLAQGEDPSAPDDGAAPDGDPPDADATPDPGGSAGQTPQDPSGEAPLQQVPEEQAPDGQAPDSQAPNPFPPGQAPQDDPQDGQVELARLFDLTQLPTRTSEADTTLTQTSAGDEDPSIEQLTRLEHPDGDILVSALRSADARERFEALVDEDARELSVRGQPAFLLEGQRLVWLVEGTGDQPDTFLQIDAPTTLGTDEVLTIANGLELS